MFTHPDIALAIEAYLSLHGKGEGTDILSVEKEIRRLSPERAGNCPTSSSWPGKTATWR